MLAVIVPLLAGVIVMVVVTSIFVTDISDYLVSHSQVQIVSNQQASLTRQATDKAQLIEEYASMVVSDMITINKFATDLINGNINASNITSYYTFSAPPQNPYSSSVWWLINYTDPANMPDHVLQEVNATSLLDVVFQVVLLANENYDYFQMGVWDTGLFRMYPWNDLTTYGATRVCDKTGLNINGYDPRCRVWFTGAQAVPGEIIFTAPYITSTASRDLVIAIAVSQQLAGELWSVISLDFKVTTLQESILSTKFLQTGYAYVVDWTGNMIFHPDINYTKAVPPFQDLEFPGNSGADDFSNFQSIFTRMLAGNNETTTFTKGGQEWYISYAPAPSAKYSLAIVVPADEVLAPVNHFRDQMHSRRSEQIGVFVAIIVVTVIVLFVIISVIAGKVVRPVTELTELCRKITNGDLDYDLVSSHKSSKEISDMYLTFGQLLTALRFGNDDYYKGNKEKAMTNYMSALAMFSQFENKKGMGICYNNIANVHRANRQFEKAEENYNNAIELGVVLNDPPSVASQRTLASRYNNLAMLYLNTPGLNPAYDQKCAELLHKAIDLDRNTSDNQGLVAHFGNLALLKLKLQQHEEAAACMQQVEGVIRTGHPTAEVMRQYENVQKVFAEASANPHFFTVRARLKDVFFLLDSSGSMSGAKNTSSVAGMRSIYTKDINVSDRVCLITFSSYNSVIFPLLEKGPNDGRIRMHFDSLRKPEGGTSFFDALGAAFNMAAGNPSTNEQWIIALTDGDDNQSKTHSAESVIKLAYANSATNLIIIAVGTLSSREQLQQCCSATAKGRLIDIDDREGVGQAIGAAFEEIASMMAAGVETYNFKSDD